METENKNHPLVDIRIPDADKRNRTDVALEKDGITLKSPNYREKFIEYYEKVLGGRLLITNRKSDEEILTKTRSKSANKRTLKRSK